MKCGAQLFWALLLSCWLQAHSFSHHVADAGKLRGSSLSLSQAGRRWFKNTDETVGVLRFVVLFYRGTSSGSCSGFRIVARRGILPRATG